MSRIVWIDYAKTIGIFFVVLGHALSYNIPDEATFRNFIYLFHMPLFFFISGFLFKYDSTLDFKQFLLKDIKSLIIPYIFLNLVACVCLIPLSLFTDIDFKFKLYQFIVGKGHAPAGPAWFLLCLFWVRMIAFFSFKFSRVSLCCVMAGMCVLSYFFPWHLFYSMDVAIVAFPLFGLGWFSRYYGVFSKTNKKLILLPSFVIFLSLSIICSSILGRISMYSRQFGTIPCLFWVGTLCGILMVLTFCMFFRKENKYVKVISSGTILIMALHGVLYPYINQLFRFLMAFFGMHSYEIAYKSTICLLITIFFYFPILWSQKYIPFLIGNRGVHKDHNKKQ